MSAVFRDLLRKIGSGNHTSKSLNRTEAAIATKMILQAQATPAQIGAFLIAHRIKRPTGEELAGMLDAYDQLGPSLKAISSLYPPIVLGIPYDGRSRTIPVSPIVALILASVGQPTIMHGGGRLPTKYGLPLVEVWHGLGVNWTNLSLEQVQRVLETVGIGFIYTPHHFPLTNQIWEYREQLGKRPPLASMELIWCPYRGNAHQIIGFVHPPSKARFQIALQLRGAGQFTTIKGLEGSCDLPRDRTTIIGFGQGDGSMERFHLSPIEYGFYSSNMPLNPDEVIFQLGEVVNGKNNQLAQTVIWNGGFYLWRCGCCESIQAGIAKAELLLTSGVVAKTLASLIKAVQSKNL